MDTSLVHQLSLSVKRSSKGVLPSRGNAGSPQYPQAGMGRPQGLETSLPSGCSFGPPATIPGKSWGSARNVASQWWNDHWRAWLVPSSPLT